MSVPLPVKPKSPAQSALEQWLNERAKREKLVKESKKYYRPKYIACFTIYTITVIAGLINSTTQFIPFGSMWLLGPQMLILWSGLQMLKKSEEPLPIRIKSNSKGIQ